MSHIAPAIFEAALVIAFFTGVAVFATWPVASRPLGGFYGFGNDNWGGIPYLGWLNDAYLGPGDPAIDPEFQAPFGLNLPEYAIQPLDRLFALFLGGFDQGLGAYNAQVFSSFVIAGCTMYVAGRYLVGSKLAALVAGFAFTFSPFHLSLAMQYNALAAIQWVPLYLLALILLLRVGSRANAVFTGAAFALVALSSYYYAWFVGWLTLLLLGYAVAAAGLRRRRRGQPVLAGVRPSLGRVVSRGAIAAGVALAVMIPFLLVSIRGAAGAGSRAIEHPVTEAIRYSARPWMLFVPPHDNPIVGARVRPWVMEHIFESPIYEQSIYLGYVILALVVVALCPARRWKSAPLPGLSIEVRGLLVAGAVAGVLIMLGPYIPIDWGYGYWRNWQTPDAVTKVPSVGWLMYELGPVFRFFTRAFVLVSACLVLLAAIGFARLEKLPLATPTRRAVFAATVIGFIALEFTNAPPHLWLPDSPPPRWVEAVKRLPRDSTVVDYPVAAAFSPRSLYYMFWQSKHRRATVNPPERPEAAAFAAEISAPDDPGSGAALHRAGIDYAIVHTRLPPQTRPPYQPALPDDSMPADAGMLNPWFELVTRTDDAVVYRVRSAPKIASGAFVRPGLGFGGAELEGAARARWLEAPAGILHLYVSGRPRRLRLLLTLSSFAQPRAVVAGLEGRVVAEFAVPVGRYAQRPVSLGRLAPGTHTITLQTQPGPQPVSEVTGTDDTRSVSIRLREPIVVQSAD